LEEKSQPTCPVEDRDRLRLWAVPGAQWMVMRGRGRSAWTLIRAATGQDTIQVKVMYPVSDIQFHDQHLPIFLKQMKEAGFDDTPTHRYIQHTDVIWRATRIILDVRLHRGEIGVDEATDLGDCGWGFKIMTWGGGMSSERGPSVEFPDLPFTSLMFVRSTVLVKIKAYYDADLDPLAVARAADAALVQAVGEAPR